MTSPSSDQKGKSMKLFTITVLAGLLAACATEDSGPGQLDENNPVNNPNNRETAKDPSATGSTANHNNDSTGDPSGGNTDNTAQKIENDQRVGGPDVVSRLHACGKISTITLGNYLLSRGLPQNGRAYQAFTAGIQSLGAPSYGARVPEAAFPSISAHSKMFDISVLAAQEIITGMKTSTACPGVDLVSTDGKSLTKDGISCLIGAPATNIHVEQAAAAIAENATDGAKIAVAAIIQSTIVCE
jgi:hypothetical protein